MLTAAQGEGLDAVWVLESDPVGDCPETGVALAHIPFLVVQDQVTTETTALAEVVLPAATLAESDGTLINLTGRLQVLRAAKRSPGQARPAWWIVAEVARRMLDARRQRAWQFASAAGVFAEIARVVPAYRGLTLDTIPEEGFQSVREQAGPAKAARRSFVRAGVGSPGQGPQTTVDGPSSFACRPSPKPDSDESNR
jgi:predicted molibdopterin-dependent oxidoreductase YjgC